MMELYIDHQLVDLYGDEETVGTYGCNSLGTLASRQGFGTEVFKLPLTNNNKQIFGYANRINSASNKPYQRLHARIAEDGVTQMIGFAQLISCRGEFELRVVGGNADWFNLLGDKKLTDLDIVEGNHFWTATNVRDARLNNTAWTDIYNYPNVEYGEFFTLATDPEWYKFYGGIFEKYLFWKILQEINHTPAGSWWNNDTLWAKKFLPWSAKWHRDKHYHNRNYVKAEWAGVPYGYPGTIHLKFDNIIDSTDYPILSSDISLGGRAIWVFLDSCTATIRITATIDSGSNQTIYVETAASVIQPDGTTQIFTSNVETLVTGPGNNVQFDIDITVKGGEAFALRFYTSVGAIQVGPMEAEVISWELHEDWADDELVIQSAPTYDDTTNYVALAGTLPDITCIDYLLMVFNEFALMAQTDNQTGYIRFFTFDEVIANIPNAMDFRDKVDLTEPPGIVYQLDNYGQDSVLKYADDPEDRYLSANPSYGKGVIEVEDENLDKEVIVYEAPFALVIRQSDSFNGNIRLGYVPKFDGFDGEELECIPRTAVIEFENIHLITMNGYALEPVQPSIHGQVLSFSELIPVYYITLRSMLDHTKIIPCLLRWTKEDISQLDFSVPLFLEVDGEPGYFFIDQIKEKSFTRNRSTDTTLIRIG